MTWDEINWPVLERLREGFLHGGAAAGVYWKSAEDLANYDFTYGERIGWKWDAVLRELELRHWQPAPGASVFDWGCGSGIAARRVIAHFGAETFSGLTVWDHSTIAVDFASSVARNQFPSLQVAPATPRDFTDASPIGLLVISHVLNELSPAALADLERVVARAESVLWVEPGTSVVSRQLGAIRDRLINAFHVIAPCTHALPCPALAPENERHWCHFFAPPPAGIFADSNWVKFGQRAGIDLRSLPYAFLALDRRPRETLADGWSRIIGRPEHFKPYARFLNCDATGLAELTLPKRAAPALFKELERTRAPLVYRWTRAAAQVVGGESLAQINSPAE
ncbi:small ribosomal subunit Rsm22 family protein [Horticoccus luteus]|uniref:Small ribosomal subunit Rsm22 family protein n=1 Tax=Horticoccus luteus TaxID=2862869 RepID=A0A8F9TTR3_9BACT|nr:small ribosomal subunit Rsm22 family protein [Horticoccus luteus]QYM77629.1 small ribosomal subunit Rsm22 family protein [Horticoccus luteus]